MNKLFTYSQKLFCSLMNINITLNLIICQIHEILYITHGLLMYLDKMNGGFFNNSLTLIVNIKAPR